MIAGWRSLSFLSLCSTWVCKNWWSTIAPVQRFALRPDHSTIARWAALRKAVVRLCGLELASEGLLWTRRCSWWDQFFGNGTCKNGKEKYKWRHRGFSFQIPGGPIIQWYTPSNRKKHGFFPFFSGILFVLSLEITLWCCGSLQPPLDPIISAQALGFCIYRFGARPRRFRSRHWQGEFASEIWSCHAFYGWLAMIIII